MVDCYIHLCIIIVFINNFLYLLDDHETIIVYGG